MVVRKAIGAHFAAAAMRLGMAAVLVVLLVAVAAGQSLAASLQPIADFGLNPGRLDMHVYVPAGHQPNGAMVVALHGCKQKASDFDDETGLTALAERFEFVLLLPEQRDANNILRCFNWFRAEDNEKDRGESASIRNMIRHATDSYRVDPSKVFVLGLSAGGAMTAVLLANYPELFQGGAIVAGTPYGCNAPTFTTWAMWWGWNFWYGDAAAAAYACGLRGATPTRRSPQEWGDFVRASPGTTPARWPSISLWQGDADGTVHPANQQELLEQWTNVHGIDRTPDSTEILNNIKHNVYRDAGGVARLETYEIIGFDHAFPVDPGTDPKQCGKVAGFVKDADVCSSLRILQFWGVAP